MRRLLQLVTLLALLPLHSGVASPLAFDLELHVPPVVMDSQAPTGCTVGYLVADLANDDLFVARMRVESSESDTPVNGRLPCPVNPGPRMASRALDVCRDREPDAKVCVFADMARGFEHGPNVRNTAENASRCASDRFSDIGVACWRSDGPLVCSVGCGASPAVAVSQARTRCEAKHQHACPITGSVPIAGP
ncbi:MAG TPA: hypothetical protein VHO91_00580 [Rhodopila sp.]|nr:hypothetical protein [Rhodopila sp.]